MRICQPIRAKTKSGVTFNIDIFEEGTKFSVLMTETSLPSNAVFDTATQALQEALKVASIFYDDKIALLKSSPIEEFITNEEMAKLLL